MTNKDIFFELNNSNKYSTIYIFDSINKILIITDKNDNHNLDKIVFTILKSNDF